QPHHVAMNVALLIVLPIRNRSLGEVHHHIAIRVDPLTMKSRLRETSLTLPFGVFACQQSITDEALKKRRAEGSRLDEILCVGGDDIFNVVRVIQKVSSEIKKPHAHYVAIPSAAFDESKCVAIKLGHDAENKISFWSRREWCFCFRGIDWKLASVIHADSSSEGRCRCPVRCQGS